LPSSFPSAWRARIKSGPSDPPNHNHINLNKTYTRTQRIGHHQRKYLFLKSPSTWKAEEKAHFKELRGKDLKVTKAWGARESFQHFWSFDTRVGARSFFDQWHRAADATGLRPLQKVADMFLNHITGLLSYAVHKITNAVTEGFNSKIQMIKSAARGFRSFENYRIAILFHCGKLNLHPQ
jgi:transposase